MKKNHNIYDENGVYKAAGDAIRFTGLGQSGYSENQHGVGDTDISGQRVDPVTGEFVTMLDMINIHYTAANDAQRLNASTMPSSDSEYFKVTNIPRRMSRTQADYVANIVKDALNERLQGVIPSDRVIVEMRMVAMKYKLQMRTAKILVDRALEDGMRESFDTPEWIAYYDSLIPNLAGLIMHYESVTGHLARNASGKVWTDELIGKTNRKSVSGELAEQLAQAIKANPENFNKVNGTHRYVPSIDGAPHGAEDCAQWPADDKRHNSDTLKYLQYMTFKHRLDAAVKNDPDIANAC